MSKSTFKLDNFLSEIREGSLARVNRFEVMINVPLNTGQSINEARKVSLLCEVSNLPPINLSVKPFKIYGPSYQRPTSSEYGGDGMSMTFHVDRDMVVKRFFDDWLEYIVNRNTFNVAYQNDYATEIFVRQLDEQNNVTYEIQLIDTFPRSMTLMDLNNSAQNQTHRLNVIFAYRYWRRTDIPANRSQFVPLPRVSFNTRPVIPPIQVLRETESSRVAAALGGPGPVDPNVGFAESTFESPSA